MEKTVKCPICLEPYKFYSFMVGDQSACPDCVNKASQEQVNQNYVLDYAKLYRIWMKKPGK